MTTFSDIEDVINSGNVRPSKPATTNGVSVAMVKSRSSKWKTENANAKFEGDSFVPGTRSIYVRTWGCAHNNSDSEYMTGLLAAAGYTLTDDKEAADLWVLNSCTVKTPAETQLQNIVETADKQLKPVVVAGCVSQAAPNTPFLKGVSLLGVQQIDRIVDVVEETLKGNSVRLLTSKRDGTRRLGGAPLNLPKIRKNPLIEILAINTGCLNHCTYCKTKQARGDLASYSIDELVTRAIQAFQEGVKEIWLTSEDLGAWGRDFDQVLPDLLQELVKVIPEGCMMRLGMTNPPYILDYLQEIADILNHPRVYSFLHIPVQAGNDAVLSDMRREYTNADFCRVVDFMRAHVPSISIATDMICAFPTESAEDFEDSMNLVRKYRFPSLFINQFYPRPGTPAARMKRIDTVEAKQRTKAMSELFRSYQTYGDDRIGQTYEVLVTERATDGDHLVGHNKAYEQILINDEPGLMGSFVKVRIVSTSKFSMKAELIRPGTAIVHFVKFNGVSTVVGCLCLATLLVSVLWQLISQIVVAR